MKKTGVDRLPAYAAAKARQQKRGSKSEDQMLANLRCVFIEASARVNHRAKHGCLSKCESQRQVMSPGHTRVPVC